MMRPDKGLFLSLFASRKKKKLYNLGKEDFYQSLNALNVSSSFNFHKDSNSKTHPTEKSIRFYGIEFGKTEKEIKRIFGKPNYLQKRNLPLNSQITLFYKLNIKGIKCTLQMHLYQDQLFYAQIQLRNSHALVKKTFLDLIRLKYNVSDIDWDQSIEDVAGGKIALKNDIIPKASYFSPDKALWKKIGQELSEKATEESYWSQDLKKIALRWS